MCRPWQALALGTLVSSMLLSAQQFGYSIEGGNWHGEQRYSDCWINSRNFRTRFAHWEAIREFVSAERNQCTYTMLRYLRLVGRQA